MKMKILLVIFFVGIFGLISASDDQVTELPNPITLDGTRLMTTDGHVLAKRQNVIAPKEQSSSESSEEKVVKDAVGTAVTPIGVIADTGVPVVETSARKRRQNVVAPKEQSSSESSEEKGGVKDVLSASATPVGVISDTGVPVVATRKRRQIVTPKEQSSSESSEEKGGVKDTAASITPVGVSSDTGVVETSARKRRQNVDAPKEQSSSESSEEKKDNVIGVAATLTSTSVTPVGVIPDTGVPVVDAARKRRTVTETQKSEDMGSEVVTHAPKVGEQRQKREDFREPVTEPPRDSVTPQGVEKDDKLPELGLGSRRKRDETDVGDASYPVTDPPKAAVTPQGVEKEDWLPDLGLGTRKKREEEFREPVTEPPRDSVTPEGVEKDDKLPELGLGSRRKRDESEKSDDVGDASYPVTEPPKAAVTPQGVEKEDWLPDLGLGTRKRREADYAQSRARRYA